MFSVTIIIYNITICNSTDDNINIIIGISNITSDITNITYNIVDISCNITIITSNIGDVISNISYASDITNSYLTMTSTTMLCQGIHE